MLVSTSREASHTKTLRVFAFGLQNRVPRVQVLLPLPYKNTREASHSKASRVFWLFGRSHTQFGNGRKKR